MHTHLSNEDVKRYLQAWCWRPVIFSSVGIKSHICGDLDTTQANFKDRAAWPTAVLVCAARNPSISSKVMQPVGNALNTATALCSPEDGGTSPQSDTSLYRTHFYSTRLNTRLISLVCDTTVLTTDESMFPVVIYLWGKKKSFTRATVTFPESHNLSTFF